jgi:phenylalanyl-tRNA synthetase beta chain
MKILYSQTKELLPNLKATPREVGKALTLIGFIMDGFEEVRYQNKKDYLISLEVRQNRADCLSVIGLSKELSAYYGLSIKLPEVPLSFLPSSKDKLDIKVEDDNYVKRILAVKIKGLKNSRTPQWLREFLLFYEINSVNFLVDLSNYVMLLTGYPSHLLDADKINGQIFWSLNRDFNEITTLHGSNVKLKGDELVIRDNENVLALAGIVGGKTAEIDLNTKSIIAEIAVYDHSIIRENSRSLNIITEASNRLSKRLDPNGSEFAMGFLISAILKECGGSTASEVFEYYPQKYIPPEIKFDPETPSSYSGIDIPTEESVKILKSLNFKVEPLDSKLVVTPPVGRLDVSIPEDLIEEVVRMFGYDKIPSNEVPRLELVEDITPKRIYLAEKIRDVLSTLDLDEILSLPLVKKGSNSAVNYLDWEVISTENSANEDYPELRQSLAIGLIEQFQEYLKKNVKHIKIFEIGKVFGKKRNHYQEYETCGILVHTFSRNKELSVIKRTVETLLRLIGFADILYLKSKNKPRTANPYSCWDVSVSGETVGILYKLKPQRLNKNTYFAEFNLDKLVRLLQSIRNNPVVELDQKLVVLDANIELEKNKPINGFLAKIKNEVKKENIWSMTIIDKFPLKEKNRYTIRVSYKGLSDQEAKRMHLRIFNLQ